jgi:glycosyltransferase involved in cell wall biosynthesis
MHIAIDARELVVYRPTGVGRYLSRLLEHWDGLPAAATHRFTLFAHRPFPFATRTLAVDRKTIAGSGGTRWEQGALAVAVRRLRPDVLFAPAYTSPVLCPVPVALAVHDASFAAHPEWFAWREGLRRRVVTRLAARRARVVLTLSAFSRDEIVRFLGVEPRRVRVVPLGLGLHTDGQTPLRAGRTAPVILFVGSMLNRRHVDVLVRALPVVLRRVSDAQLVLVGDNRTRPRVDPAALAEELGVAAHVTVAAYVDDAQLRRFYAEASVFAFLSEYEGFGLTPIEALAAGVPPVMLDTRVAREVCGPAAVYVAAPDTSLVAEALVSALVDGNLRQNVLDHAPAVLARYRWTDAAAATLQAIVEAAR